MPRLIALLCLLLACGLPAAAQAPIHRCIGANGGAVFTDQPCAALQAAPAAPPAAKPGNAVAEAAPPVLCAATLDELRRSVIGAFASRDGNRLSGLMLWDDYGHAAAIADIRALNALVAQPLLDVDVPGADTPAAAASTGAPSTAAEPSPAAEPPPTRSAGTRLVLHIAGGDGTREQRFDIVRQAGCLWLRAAR